MPDSVACRMPDGNARVDDALAEILAIAGSGEAVTRKSDRKKRRRFRVLRWIAPPIVFAVLPFIVLLRASVMLYYESTLPIWALVTVSAVLAGGIVLLGAWWAVTRLGLSMPRYAARISMLLAGAYCAFGLVYVSVDNVKSEDIRTTYLDLHPVLRLSVSTLVMLDSDAVITAGQRVPEDYGTMGLRVNPNSLHYKGQDGYVHALDLRTIGRPEIVNDVTALYFRMLGFHVLRHVGTADHLHVALIPR